MFSKNKTKKILSTALMLAFATAAGAAQQVKTELSIRYDSGGADTPTSATMDIDGNLYLSGTGSATGNYYNHFLTKYDAYGRKQWTQNYNSGSASWFSNSNSIIADRQGNAFMALSESYHFGAILKFDANGNIQQISQGDGVPESYEHKVGLALDDTGNLYLRATYLVEKYDASGFRVWQRMINPSYPGDAAIRDMVADKQGNVYVAARNYNRADNTNDILVAKYDTNGTKLWESRYADGGTASEGKKVKLDKQGNVVVLGQKFVNAQWDAVLLKYDANGILLNDRVVDLGGSDEAVDLALDDSGNAYVVATSTVTPNYPDIVTAKFAGDGSLVWSQRYGSSGHTNAANAIDVDALGNVAVAGGSDSYYLVTLKYDTAGAEKWRKVEPANTNGGGANWVKLVPTGDVFMSGPSYGTSKDAVLYRYDGCDCTCTP